MFAKFARFISRYWIAVLVAWVIIPVVLWYVAPNGTTLRTTAISPIFLPTMTSVRGEDLLEKAFPELASKSTVVLVVARPNGELTDEDKAVALRLADMFTPKPGEKRQSLGNDPRRQIRGRKLAKPRRPLRARFVAVEQ